MPRAIDTLADVDDLARAIGAENDRELDARVLPLANPDIAAIERGGVQAHDRLARTWPRVGTLFQLQIVGVSESGKDDGAHKSGIVSMVRWTNYLTFLAVSRS